MPEQQKRWSDDRLEVFYQEFQAHLKTEEEERAHQKELHEAVFQREDLDANVPPGLLQMCARMSQDVRTLKIERDRQMRFIGGVTFAFTCVVFLFSDTAHKVLAWLKSL